MLKEITLNKIEFVMMRKHIILLKKQLRKKSVPL